MKFVLLILLNLIISAGFTIAHAGEDVFRHHQGVWMGSFGFMGFFGWIFMILVIFALILLIIWLIKQIQKK
jgi:hypothetical protein